MLTRNGQVMVRDLLMGAGTDYVVTHFNPYKQITRAKYTGDSPYDDGAWSGPEFLAPVQIPLGVVTRGQGSAEWWALHSRLRLALRPVRDEPTEAEVHWRLGGQDFMMFARPRALDPSVENVRTGVVTASCSLLALDPSIYSGGASGAHSLELGMYRTVGGAALPLGLPASISEHAADGVGIITNSGNEPASLSIRINGPTVNPRLTFSGSTGGVALWFDLALGPTDWLEVDTAEMMAVENGFISRLPQARGVFAKAEPGTSTVKYTADVLNDKSKVLIRWRDRW